MKKTSILLYITGVFVMAMLVISCQELASSSSGVVEVKRNVIAIMAVQQHQQHQHIL